jgi:hypothetical protein
MKLKIIGIVVLSLVMASSLALGDTIVSIDGTWTNLTAPNPNGSTPPFWDNPSMDVGNKNVGFILTGTNDPITGYANYDWINYSTGNAQYLATSSGGVVNQVYVTSTPPNGQSAFLIVTVAGNASGNSFGIYDITQTFNPTTPDSNHVEIFAGGTANAATWSGNVTYANYGFYFYDKATQKLFLSDPVVMASADSFSNFAIFRSTNPLQSGIYYIGMEDLTQWEINGREGCLGDYNDMIVQIQIGDAPAPVTPTALLLGTGLLGLVGLGWRRRKNA